jgi:hypothetical protein
MLSKSKVEVDDACRIESTVDSWGTDWMLSSPSDSIANIDFA